MNFLDHINEVYKVMDDPALKADFEQYQKFQELLYKNPEDLTEEQQLFLLDIFKRSSWAFWHYVRHHTPTSINLNAGEN